MTDPLVVLKKLAMLREHAARVRGELPAGLDALDRYVTAIARLVGDHTEPGETS